MNDLRNTAKRLLMQRDFFGDLIEAINIDVHIIFKVQYGFGRNWSNIKYLFFSLLFYTTNLFGSSPSHANQYSYSVLDAY